MEPQKSVITRLPNEGFILRQPKHEIIADDESSVIGMGQHGCVLDLSVHPAYSINYGEKERVALKVQSTAIRDPNNIQWLDIMSYREFIIAESINEINFGDNGTCPFLPRLYDCYAVLITSDEELDLLFEHPLFKFDQLVEVVNNSLIDSENVLVQFMVTDLYPSGSLKNWIEDIVFVNKKPVPVDSITVIVKQVILALYTMYRSFSLTHQDLKPDNVLIGLKQDEDFYFDFTDVDYGNSSIRIGTESMARTIVLTDFGLTYAWGKWDSRYHSNYYNYSPMVLFLKSDNPFLWEGERACDLWALGLLVITAAATGFTMSSETEPKRYYDFGSPVEMFVHNDKLLEIVSDMIKTMEKHPEDSIPNISHGRTTAKLINANGGNGGKTEGYDETVYSNQKDITPEMSYDAVFQGFEAMSIDGDESLKFTQLLYRTTAAISFCIIQEILFHRFLPETPPSGYTFNRLYHKISDNRLVFMNAAFGKKRQLYDTLRMYLLNRLGTDGLDFVSRCMSWDHDRYSFEPIHTVPGYHTDTILRKAMVHEFLKRNK